jgi:hypothetical protein
MNQKLQEFARNEIKEGLAKCTESQQSFFKRIYSFKNQKLSIEEIVDKLPDEKLSNIMDQIERTIIKNNQVNGEYHIHKDGVPAGHSCDSCGRNLPCKINDCDSETCYWISK